MNSSREHGALRQHVVDQLRDEIVSGELAPGTPIRTEAVMERFGVSNSPLREAFAQLAVEGLIEVYRNKGAVVSPLTRDGSAD
jgi:DNA-binding GntR family transcriptional regulator